MLWSRCTVRHIPRKPEGLPLAAASLFQKLKAALTPTYTCLSTDGFGFEHEHQPCSAEVVQPGDCWQKCVRPHCTSAEEPAAPKPCPWPACQPTEHMSQACSACITDEPADGRTGCLGPFSSMPCCVTAQAIGSVKNKPCMQFGLKTVCLTKHVT